ncbi:MAG TPA: peptidoglycan editing factor PgeF [Burkholderiales bacterium]|nr:peptidoglycan editing factor PgeF [Burkholderiales bacterium]
MDVIHPAWEAPPRVRAFVTTKALGDMSAPAARERVREMLPGEPAWLKQVHGTRVTDASAAAERPEADASFARARHRVCAVMAADCMPVLFADRAGSVVAAAHAGWRGLCAGVLEETVKAMQVEPRTLVAWLGPAIGPRAYEVGDEVRDAFLAKDARAASAFSPSRPGHWMLDLYAVARQRLAGLSAVTGGDFCTHTDQDRFFSYRRDQTKSRMAALIWLT